MILRNNHFPFHPEFYIFLCLDVRVVLQESFQVARLD